VILGGKAHTFPSCSTLRIRSSSPWASASKACIDRIGWFKGTFVKETSDLSTSCNKRKILGKALQEDPNQNKVKHSDERLTSSHPSEQKWKCLRFDCVQSLITSQGGPVLTRGSDAPGVCARMIRCVNLIHASRTPSVPVSSIPSIFVLITAIFCHGI
jgi:hypothetical protein